MIPIFLCGFMGCGKTTVGRLVAEASGRAFIDLDEYIEQAADMTIPEIFERYGEAHFRSLETEALKVLSHSFTVVATGGGALLEGLNVCIASKNGLIIFIDTPFEMCYDRIKDDPHRPIAASSTKEQLKARFDERYPKYKANSAIKISGEGTPEEIAARILEVI